MRVLLALLLLGTALAGCSGAGPDPPADASDPPAPTARDLLAMADCGDCFEPTVAVHDGVVYATVTSQARMAVVDGDGVREVPLPPVPGKPSADVTDVFIEFDGQGRLWYHNVFRDQGLVPDAVPTAIQVARSDDLGATWSVNQVLRVVEGSEDFPTDRNWLAVHGDRVLVLCTCPIGQIPQYWISEDGGETFDGPTPLLEGSDMQRTLGRPAVLDDGTVAIAYHPVLQDSRDQQGERSLGINTVVSTDGRTWQRGQVVPPTGAALCCGMLPMSSDGERFTLAWIASDRTVRLSESTDGLAWQTSDVSGTSGAASPQPHAVRLGDDVLVAWYEGEPRRTVHLSVVGGRDLALGTSPALPSDYGHLATDGSTVATAWPDGGLRLWSAPVGTVLG